MSVGGDDPRMRELLEELGAARFLAKASETLAQVEGYEPTLERIARLAVPSFADWFGVHIRQADGSTRRIAVKHLDPKMEAMVREIYQRYPPTQGKPYGAIQVMETGEPAWLPDFSQAIPSVARDSEHARMLAALGLRSFICVPMKSHGKVVGALTFATAESGRTYSEIHRRAAEDLAARAATAIENAQLIEALRDADRRKDEFLAMLAHELRNPLAPVRNAVEILRSKPAATAEAQWITDVLDRQVRQLARLVDDLLEVARFASGKIELRKARIALADVISAAVEASRPAIERAQHHLEIELPAQALHLDADAVRLSQVLSNLLNNAAKYSPPGGHITLTAALQDRGVVIRVRDSGDGIAPEMQDRIFGMFVQGPAGGQRTQGGLGIGLTLVRRLVELHGGTVCARSEGVGKGSEFVVWLPGPA